MLGKLIKHDFLAGARFLTPAYVVMLVIALLGRAMTWLATRQYIIDNAAPGLSRIISILSSLLTVAFMLAPFIILFMAGFYVIWRFYKNLFTDEGYLMNTLPTKPVSLVCSKLVTALIWMLLTMAVAALSWYIALGHVEALTDTLHQLWDSFVSLIVNNEDVMNREIGVPLWLFVVELVFFLLCWFARFTTSWFFAIAMGQLITKDHKVLGAIGSYIGLAIVSNIISTVYMGILNKAVASATNAVVMQATILGNSLLMIVITALLYWAVCSIMKNRLNLD